MRRTLTGHFIRYTYTSTCKTAFVKRFRQIVTLSSGFVFCAFDILQVLFHICGEWISEGKSS